MNKAQIALNNKEEIAQKRPYTRPAIIYSTEITTRAGSPLAVGDGNAGASGVDPADLFGD